MRLVRERITALDGDAPMVGGGWAAAGVAPLQIRVGDAVCSPARANQARR
jgi:hypothetical protein